MSDTGPHHHGPGQTFRRQSPAPEARDAFQFGMEEGMARMMRDMHVRSTGDPDRDFLAMMIPHHQGAVDMARLVLVHGRDPLVRQLAEEIIASQTTEIAGMRARLDVLRTGPDPNPGGYPALGAVRR